MLQCTCIILSVFSLCLETVPSLRVPKNHQENDTTFQNHSENMRIFLNTRPSWTLWSIEFFSSLLMTLELLITLVVCPSFKQLMSSFMIWVDIVSLGCFWILMLLRLDILCHHNCRTIVDNLQITFILSTLRVLRIFRIFKLKKRFICLKVILMTFKASMKELALMIGLLLIGMLIFSTAIYLAELHDADIFHDLDTSMWWAVVTMTTVGYGNIHPKSLGGYLVGTACIIYGVLITYLTLPIINKNFSKYYRYSYVRESLDNEKRKRRESSLSIMSITSRTTPRF